MSAALGAAVLAASWAHLASRFHLLGAGRQAGPVQEVVLAWGAVALAGYFVLAAFGTPLRADPPGEISRWILIGVASLYLLSGFEQTSLHGGGDARWYATMLADMVAQTRSGVFPVWIGQSPFQFNGAVYPLRVAPAYLYYGAAVDALTLHSLEIYTLQNLTLLLIGVASAYSAYFCLAALLPGRRSLAAALALLFVGCPGVLGVAYNSDLYMSWTTLPLVPLVLYSTVCSFRDGGAGRSMLVLGASLALCWWGHSPIAVWLTLIALVLQCFRVAVTVPGRKGWRAIGLGACAFAFISAYPVGSVLLYPTDPAGGGTAFQPATPASVVVGQIESVFPANLMPLSAAASTLSDFQLGYSLLALLTVGAFFSIRAKGESPALFLIAALLLLLVAIPIPHVELLLWKAVPPLVRKITARWAMNRLYVPLAALTVFGVASAAVRLDARRARLLMAIAAVGAAWSLLEARKFLAETPKTPRDEMLGVENAMLTRYAYFGFPRMPDAFTDGVAEPALENRLLADPTGGVISSNLDAASGAASPGTNIDVYATSSAASEPEPTLRIEPGRHYLAEFTLGSPEPQGVLQLSGPRLFREYGLPEYGGPLSFGAGGKHSRFLPLSTSVESGEDVAVRFVPSDRDRKTDGPIASVRLRAYDPARLPIRVSSWIPYRATVTAGRRAWLETPRMFQDGFVAFANGQPCRVSRSAQGLVAIEVPAGTSEVELKYVVPWGLAGLFWLSTVALALAAGTLALGRVSQRVAAHSSAA